MKEPGFLCCKRLRREREPFTRHMNIDRFHGEVMAHA